MRTVWNIVRKDFRRLALPWCLWLGLVLLHTSLLMVYRGDSHVEAVAFNGLLYYTYAVGAIVLAVGFLLAAWLVMEDSLVVTQAFWPTRPISGVRLLAAKVLGAFLMFSVAPVVVLTPVWLGCGFSFRELGVAALQQAIQQGLLSVAAFAIAGVTATSGQFLVRLVGAAILLPMSLSFALGRMTDSDAALSTGTIMSRSWLVWVVVLATPPMVVVHQYLTRRTVRSWMLAGLGFAVMMAVPYGWFWDISPLIRSERLQDNGAAPEANNVVVNVRWTNVSRDLARPGHPQINQGGDITGVPAGAYVLINPSLGEWVSGKERRPLPTRLRNPSTDRRPPELLVRQVAGLPGADPGPVMSWRVDTAAAAEQTGWARAANFPLETTLGLTLMRGRVLGEMPLQAGAELRAGACLTRIIGIERVDEKILIRLEDRDAGTNLPPDESSAGMVWAPVRPAEDGFVLQNRRHSVAQVPALREIGIMRINSIIVGQRVLVVEPPTQEVNGRTVEIPDWEQGAVLTQVRFSPESTFTRTLRATPFAP